MMSATLMLPPSAGGFLAIVSLPAEVPLFQHTCSVHWWSPGSRTETIAMTASAVPASNFPGVR